jgi:hypothetical protein
VGYKDEERFPAEASGAQTARFVRTGRTENDNGGYASQSTGRSACATEAAWKAALQEAKADPWTRPQKRTRSG